MILDDRPTCRLVTLLVVFSHKHKLCFHPPPLNQIEVTASLADRGDSHSEVTGGEMFIEREHP